MSSSLRQDVLRAHVVDLLNRELQVDSIPNKYDSDEEMVGVFSAPGTPFRSRAPSRTSSRATSPTRSPMRKAFSLAPLTSSLSQGHKEKDRHSQDPLRVFPTELSQRIFGKLSIADLAKCAIVSKRWSRSQSINYIWFLHYRRELFIDDNSIPSGKWTRRESRQNWRLSYQQHMLSKSPPMGPIHLPKSGYSTPTHSYYGSGYHSPKSGYLTPKEIREEKWKTENEVQHNVGKVEMREMYKELGGRKMRGKGKLGAGGIRDKGGWGESELFS